MRNPLTSRTSILVCKDIGLGRVEGLTTNTLNHTGLLSFCISLLLSLYISLCFTTIVILPERWRPEILCLHRVKSEDCLHSRRRTTLWFGIGVLVFLLVCLTVCFEFLLVGLVVCLEICLLLFGIHCVETNDLTRGDSFLKLDQKRLGTMPFLF
jgi:hypothetical protein